MSMLHEAASIGRLSRNRIVVALCAALVVGMVGLSFASVPLYRVFCQVTGYGGTTRRASVAPAPKAVLDRSLTVEFDANVGPGITWRFEPVQRQQQLKIGEQGLAFYRASNLSNTPQVGMAVFNVTPHKAGSYFNKIQCFCFTAQRLDPGQTVEMPVAYFIDPAIVDDPDLKKLTTITLSYTFYPAGKAPIEASASPPDIKAN
jgi:cytochrome c oxidase assembly protein subunit 11